MARVRLKLVISGGQTGADKTALVCAYGLGIQTGGVVPRGCRTDEGPDTSLVETYGCVEDNSFEYPPRTRKNARAADVTVWFGYVDSPGYRLTERCCRQYAKPFVVNPSPPEFRSLAEMFEVMNVAGNRRRKNPKVVEQVEAAFQALRENNA